MASLTNAAEAAILDLIFLNLDWANIGDAGGLQNSAAAGDLYVSLHSSDPGEAGNQASNEISYTTYARVAVPRSGSGWSRSGSIMSNVAEIAFPICSSGSATATHWGIGTDSSGSGNLLFHGDLNQPLDISAGITPRYAAGALDIEAL